MDPQTTTMDAVRYRYTRFQLR